MSNVSTQIADALQSHNIDLMRLEAGLRRDVVRMFNRMTPKMIEMILKKVTLDTVTITARSRQLRILVEGADHLIDELYDQLELFTHGQAVELAGLEAIETAAAINGVLNVELVTGRLSAERLASIASNTLISGAPSKEWWGSQKRVYRDAFKREMRAGLLLNETIPKLVQRVRGTRANGFNDGITKLATRKAEALVRSSVMAVANNARMETFKRNEAVVKGFQWLSTLDGRTTNICKALDGQAWYQDGRKMPGTEMDFRGPPPAHWNCRSSLVPVLRSWSDLARDKVARNKLRKAEKKLPSGLRSSMDGAVSDKLDYEGWLKTKDEAFQKDVLGPTKYRLWKKGKLPFTELVSQNHKPLTVNQIVERTQ